MADIHADDKTYVEASIK